jgi:hypothetical protein
MPLNPTEKKQLDKLEQDAMQGLKAWVKYCDDLNDYIIGRKTDTVPPGQPPPNPPGH